MPPIITTILERLVLFGLFALGTVLVNCHLLTSSELAQFHALATGWAVQIVSYALIVVPTILAIIHVWFLRLEAKANKEEADRANAKLASNAQGGTTVVPSSQTASSSGIPKLTIFLLIGMIALGSSGCAGSTKAVATAETVAANPIVATLSPFAFTAAGQETALLAVKNIQSSSNETAKIGLAVTTAAYEAFASSTPTTTAINSAIASAKVGLTSDEQVQFDILWSSLVTQGFQPLALKYPALAADAKDFFYGADIYFTSQLTPSSS